MGTCEVHATGHIDRKKQKKKRKRNRHVKGHTITKQEIERREGGEEKQTCPKGYAPPAALRARCYMATLGRMTLLSAARKFPLVFTRVNIVCTTRRAKGNGPGGPAQPCHEDEIIAAGAYERKTSPSRR
jgi:hypothetical protein